MKNVNWKDLLERAAWTFLEAFVVAFFGAFSIGMDEVALKAALFGAGTAGLSALKTFVINLIRQHRHKLNDILDDELDDEYDE